MIWLLALAVIQAPPTIQWQGYTWHVKAGDKMGPGPNRWDPANVAVDPKGFLHLRIAQSGSQWSCAEIWTDQRLGYGTYQCQVESPLNSLDPNPVFSIFSYAGPDGVKEIDIEAAKWGKVRNKDVWWTVYPNDSLGAKSSKGIDLGQNGAATTLRYTWTNGDVHYGIFSGSQPIESAEQLIREWDDRPDDRHSVPQSPMPLHFNLWLFQGKPPKNGLPVEIVVRSFDFAALR
jgi:hypothetical protein